jgi:glycosyltransferase involved in cell wall biosynthesis
VAARDASVAEIVLDEATGVLYDPDTPDALAASLARLLTAPDLARLMGLAARARVQADFSAQRLALAVQSLYDDLLSIGPESIP